MEKEFEKEVFEKFEQWKESTMHMFDALTKSVDDVLWRQQVQDVADFDKVRLLGPPPREDFPESLLLSPQEKKNPVVIQAYTFIPKDIDRNKKYPLLVYPHGGVHSNFGSRQSHVVRELLSQGYLIIAPEYRGSTGYGEKFYKMIDYGGAEIEDTFAARNWMVENIDRVDPDRIGILGWSHGGLHTLMNIFHHPDAYKVAYACVPVSDLVARMGYQKQRYRDLFSADYHIGRTAHEDIEEYKRRSPAWNVEKLETPLLIHTTTNDEDVNVLEVQHLIKSLQAANKRFEYKIYEDAPGGHRFNTLDTRLARESRKEVYKFLSKHLNPPHKI